MSGFIESYREDRIIETVAKIVLVGMLIYSSYLILKPFIGIVVWAIIIAVTMNPLITTGEKYFGWSRTKVSTYFTIIIIALILIPAIGLALSFSDTLQTLIAGYKAGTLTIPPPNPKVETWPIIGKYIYPIWNDASVNLSVFLISHKTEIMPIAKTVLSTIGNGVVTVLMFIASMAIAAVFTSTSHACAAFTQTVASRLAGDRGIEWMNLSTMTIRSVVQGVIGIALIQATAAYVLFVIFGIPMAIVFAFLIMLVAIAQIPTMIILIFPIIYMFSTGSTTEAVAFLIFANLVGLSDNILKPLLLGRGVDAPMLVILLGAIGGMIIWGILGLFIGSVLLTVAYKLFLAWVYAEAKEKGIATEEILL